MRLNRSVWLEVDVPSKRVDSSAAVIGTYVM
jgi:hypothetical protein